MSSMTGDIHAFARNPGKQRPRWNDFTMWQSTYLAVHRLQWPQCLLSVLLSELRAKSRWAQWKDMYMHSLEIQAIKDTGGTTLLHQSRLTLWSIGSSVSLSELRAKWRWAQWKDMYTHSLQIQAIKDKGETTLQLISSRTLQSNVSSCTSVSFRSYWENCKQSRDEFNDGIYTCIRSKSKQSKIKAKRLHYVTIDLPCSPSAPVSTFGPFKRIISKRSLSSTCPLVFTCER
jgi:hypothetical protein